MSNSHFLTVGDTVKIKATFYDFDGVPADPTGVVASVFSVKDMSTAKTQVPLSGVTYNPEVGVWVYPFSSDTVGVYLVEFKGMLGGFSVARRVRVDVKEIVEES